MNLDKLHSVYFLGIGGIGMSALARFFKAMGKEVSGYDKTRTGLTDELQSEGIDVHYEENIDRIPAQVRLPQDKNNVLIVWTPAVPADHSELVYFREQGFAMKKRAEVLGMITEQTHTIAVAGTHGKTTTTTLTAHLLRSASVDCSAFLGGISLNYNTNLLLSPKLGQAGVAAEENIVVAEADEYDRSFLWLHPMVEVITSVDADHLDIYGDKEQMHDTYRQFASQVKKGGMLVTKPSVVATLGLHNDYTTTYALNDEQAMYHARNIRVEQGVFVYDIVCPGEVLENVKLGLPGRHNVENSVAAVAAAKQLNVGNEAIRRALESFRGVKRRFEYRIRTPKLVYIDDYGHHPEELRACISSVRELYPGRKITGIFQPHLFSRTRDFEDAFARSLELLDEVVLLEIYPAREKPIPGVTSAALLAKVNRDSKMLCQKNELVEQLMKKELDVVVTLGAGDIDQFVVPIEKALAEKYQVKPVQA